MILATRAFAKEYRGRSWWHLIITLVVLAAGYTAVFLVTPLWAKAICALLVAFTLGRMFVLYHDFLHRSILDKSKAAKGIFTVVGWYMLAPASIWERSHNYHHAHNSKLYTSSIGSFPVVTKEKYLASPRSERFAYLFVRHPVTIGLGYIFMFIYGMCIRSFASNSKKHWDSLVALAFHFAVGTTIFLLAGWLGLLFGFLIPFFISLGLGSYLFYAQHNFPGVQYAEKDGWTYHDAALTSSSYMRMSWVMRWFLANIGFHHIHHLNPRIPFYRLPEAYRAMPELQQAKKTSLLPWDVIRCLRLKVWDPAQQRMLSRREIYA